MSRGTPHRTVRIPDQVWADAQATAAREGTTVTAVIVEALTRYSRRHKPTTAPR